MSPRRVFRWALLCAIAALVAGCEAEPVKVAVESFDPDSSPGIAQAIRETYESRFDELESRYQAHLAVRIHRGTGGTLNLEAISEDMRRRVLRLEKQIESLETEGYVAEQGKKALAAKPELTPVQRARRKMFSGRPEILFHRSVLFTAHKMRDYGLHEGRLAPLYNDAVSHLRTVDWAGFLLDPEVIRPYAAQTSNLVYWLQRIEVVDLEAEYTVAFRNVFMSADDRNLSAPDYQNKLYGLTHFIIADSHYYQRLVPEEKYRWILDYFDDHILEILSWSKPDIIAEVALCYKLCGRPEAEGAILAQEYLARTFDETLGYIPSETGSIDFNKAEHRNAVAFLVFSNWDVLHPGPFLMDSDLDLES